MMGKIKKIQFIKQIAVFQDFNWDTSIRDEGNNIGEFKKINILYGRNYAGKTTLSRIIRALETGVLSEKYDYPKFSLVLEQNETVTQNSLSAHTETIRVFNEDFIKENLHFITNEEHSINSFAILGDNNNKIKKEIEALELQLGSEIEGTGLYGKLKDATTIYGVTDNNYNEADKSLENKLIDKANKANTGIKHNKLFGDANYNVLKIKKDISIVIAEQYKPLSEDQVSDYNQLLKEEAKPTISESPPFNLKFELFSQKTRELVEKKITVSEPIQELLNDATLQIWVRAGREYHESRRTTCGFCGGALSKSLWERLDKHFNQESENLRLEIESLIKEIETEKNRIPMLIMMRNNNFYSTFHIELGKLNNSFELIAKKYCSSLDALANQLTQRKNNVFNPSIFTDPANFSQELNSIRDKYEQFCIQSNQFTISLSSKQNEARCALRLYEVYKFTADIKYQNEYDTIKKLKSTLTDAEKNREIAQQSVDKKNKDILSLKVQLKDESKGAERVNDFLNNFFGHKYLSLKAIKIPEEDKKDIAYCFEVTRDGKKAYHLSEGECSLIAFCYFVAKLEDVETKGSQPIIWIDDPVSSLDANHIFFLYALINDEIVNPDKFKQLFISTHNLQFLKYLKRLSGARNNKKSEYFVIQRNEKDSNLKLMPRYLKEYVTEFNFLFHQIYKCAKANSSDDSNHDCYYNFGNNARKFLEVFLYYKYPNLQERNDENGKLKRFFGGNALASYLIDRINNEYSHLNGEFERSIMPIDIPEMKTTAQFILEKIKENDIDQFNALLESIGEVPVISPIEDPCENPSGNKITEEV